MSQPVDAYLMKSMIDDEDHELFMDTINGTDDSIDRMMEEKSRMEISESVFPTLENFKTEDIDPYIKAIGESMKVVECSCGKLLNEGERCNDCRKSNKGGILK